MKPNFPPKWSILIVWVFLLAYLSISFLYKPNSIFFQLNYDWKSVEVIENMGKVAVDTLSHDYLAIKNPGNETQNINLQNTFQIEGKEKRYFRASNISILNHQIQFSGVKWINGIPDNNINSTNFQIIHLPIIQNGSKSVTTIGDSQMLWNDGRDFRKNLHLKNNDLIFYGNSKDVYGYSHEAGIYSTTNEILNSLPSISATSYYVLFFGAHDKNSNREILQVEVCEIIATLSERKQTEKIIILNLPPSPNKEFEEFNKAFNKILNSCSTNHENVQVISLYDTFQTQENYLIEDGVHLNAHGLHIVKRLLNKAFK